MTQKNLVNQFSFEALLFALEELVSNKFPFENKKIHIPYKLAWMENEVFEVEKALIIEKKSISEIEIELADVLFYAIDAFRLTRQAPDPQNTKIDLNSIIRVGPHRGLFPLRMTVHNLVEHYKKGRQNKILPATIKLIKTLEAALPKSSKGNIFDAFWKKWHKNMGREDGYGRGNIV